ncbi:MAG: hypothetical protein ABIS47_06250 [Acidimicrobiales bacterium]
MDGYRPETYGELIADLYDSWYGPTGVAAVVEMLHSLAGAGPVLQLAVGTGRIAVPSPSGGWRCAGSTPHRPCSTACGPGATAWSP